MQRFKVGRNSPYQPEQLLRTVEEVCQESTQMELRRRAAEHSQLFSASGLAEWIWDSLEAGEPKDDRFEKAFRRERTEVTPYLEGPTPKDLKGDMAQVYLALRRLKRNGFSPDFVLDVGASSGVWSDVANRLFPDARFILVDPLHSHYRSMNDWYFRKHPDFENVGVAVSDRAGEAEFSVSDDLYGSSLIHPQDFRSYDSLRVPVSTLDAIAAERKITGRGILKIDVQFAEHLVLAGAAKLLEQVDALLLELSLVRYAPETILFPEMCELIRNLGFRYFEDIGGWRSPVDGTPLQKDVLFLREDLLNTQAAGEIKLAISGNGNGSH